MLLPPKKPVAPAKPPVPAEAAAQALPNTLLVRHKVTGKEFEVSRNYFETYSQVLDRV